MRRLSEERCLQQKKKRGGAGGCVLIKMHISSLWKPLKATAEFACTEFKLLQRTFDHRVWQSSHLFCFFLSFVEFGILIY